MLASSVNPSSGGQRTSDEGAFIAGAAIDDLVDDFLGSISQTELCHVCVVALVRRREELDVGWVVVGVEITLKETHAWQGEGQPGKNWDATMT